MVSFAAVKRPRIAAVVSEAGSVAEIMLGRRRRPVPARPARIVVDRAGAVLADTIRAAIDPAASLRIARQRFVAGEIDVCELERRVADAVGRGA